MLKNFRINVEPIEEFLVACNCFEFMSCWKPSYCFQFNFSNFIRKLACANEFLVDKPKSAFVFANKLFCTVMYINSFSKFDKNCFKCILFRVPSAPIILDIKNVFVLFWNSSIIVVYMFFVLVWTFVQRKL